MDHSFVVLPLSAGPVEALDLLGDRTYAVVVDEDGHVVGLGTAVELAEGVPLRPGVEIPDGMDLDDVVGSVAVTLLELNPHGAVVVRDGEVLGVMTAEMIDEALSVFTVVSKSMGEGADAGLPGEVHVPAARVACAWPGCGHPNVVTFYDPDRPDLCGNPDLPEHVITLSGR